MKPGRAHGLVAAAKNAGELTPQPCEIGGDCNGKVVAHHDDYSKPLDVRWLCQRHHQLWHAKHTPTNRESDSILIRTTLTADEYREFRKLAIDLGIPVSQAAGDAIRALLREDKL